MPSQSLDEQDIISLPRPGSQEDIAPIEQHEDTGHRCTPPARATQHPSRTTHPIGASGPRITDRLIRTTASRMN